MTNPAATMIADFRAAADEIEAILAPTACATVATLNWIVIDDFGPMIFTLTPDGRKQRATCTGQGRAHKGTFPRPIRIGERAVAWRDSDIGNWLASRPPETSGCAPRRRGAHGSS